METMIASKAQLLIDAAMARWPSVYDESFRIKAEERIREHGGDEREQLYVLREYLLDRGRFRANKCEECELRKSRMCGAVWGDGTPAARIFVIGEGPSQFDQRTAIPFTHDRELGLSYCHKYCKSFETCMPRESLAGGLTLPSVPEEARIRERIPATEESLRAAETLPQINTVAGFLNAAIQGLCFRHSWNQGRMLEQSKIISNIYITNMVKCRRVDKDGENQKPTPNQVKTCSQWLDIQLAVIQPQVVILLGSLACTTIMDFAPAGFKMADHHGKFGPRHPGSFTKLPASVTHVGVSYHPSYISRIGNRSVEEQQAAFAGLRSLLEKAHNVINGGS